MCRSVTISVTIWLTTFRRARDALSRARRKRLASIDEITPARTT